MLAQLFPSCTMITYTNWHTVVAIRYLRSNSASGVDMQYITLKYHHSRPKQLFGHGIWERTLALTMSMKAASLEIGIVV